MISQQGISLFVTSGNGPEECCLAVAHVLTKIKLEAMSQQLEYDIHSVPSKFGYKSVVVMLYGENARSFAEKWEGTIKWTAKSKFRPNHKRQNWFIGISKRQIIQNIKIDIRPADVSFDSFRAGGPGGQHQNTTDSAVRATHRPTGVVAVAREMRSQHRNKDLALNRLQKILEAQNLSCLEEEKLAQNNAHDTLERGNPVRCFKGVNFKEVRN